MGRQVGEETEAEISRGASGRLCSTEPGISKRSRVTTKQRLWSGLFRSSSEVAVCQKPTAPDYRKLGR